MSQDAIIAKLHWSIQEPARDVLYLAEKDGIRLIIVQGLRTWEEQDKLFAQGRRGYCVCKGLAHPRQNTCDFSAEARVTNARGGSSWHNFGLAIDVCPLDARGVPDWNAPAATWAQIGVIYKNRGFNWGGEWKDIVDRPHGQHPACGKELSIQAARAGERPTYLCGHAP